MKNFHGLHGPLYLDMIGKFEGALEVTFCNTAVQALYEAVALDTIIAFFLAGRNGQCIVFNFNINLVISKAGNCHSNSILVFLNQFNIIGWITGATPFIAGNAVE